VTTETAEAGLRHIRASAHPNCVVCSHANVQGMQLQFAETGEGEVQARFDCSSGFEGYTGMLHGGVVASLLDGAMMNCLFARGISAVTADLAVRFRHPVVIDTPATVCARIERSSPPRHLVKAEIVQGGQVKATATGKFMEQARSAAAGHQGETSNGAHVRQRPAEPGEKSAETLAVHAGVEANEFRAVVPPIYQTSTFAFDSAEQGAACFAGEKQGYIYSRMGNPTVEALEKSVAALEGGYAGLACGSGMAAIHTALAALLQAGDHLVCSDAVYGPTCTLVETVLTRFGIDCTFVDASDSNAVIEAMQPNTRVVYIETPGNPTLVICDLETVCRMAHERGAVVVVDNTFMTPVLQQPLRWGADVVVHSLTKFLNGHADVVGGMIVVKDEAQYLTFRKILNQLGGVLPPFESFLVHRGIKTLALRMQRHCRSAMQVADFLEGHRAIEWVRYPGSRSHPQYEVARKQMTGPGGMISFGLKGGLEAGRRMMNAVRLCRLAVSLGGVESLIQHPASMTHASMGAEARRRAHISDGLVRLSVGIENVDDIIADLDRALSGGKTRLEPLRPTPWPRWPGTTPRR